MNIAFPHRPLAICESPSAERYHALLKGLERTERFTSAELWSFQFNLLRPLLVHACHNVPLYRARFQSVGLDSATMNAECWHEIPILERETLQQNELLSRSVPLQHGRLFKRQSSGSTGQPVTVYRTDYTQQFFSLLSLRDCQWHNWDFSGKFASIRYYPARDFPEEGLVLQSWGEPFDVLSRTGEAILLNVRTPISRQLEWLVRHQPDYLQTYPSNLMALIEESWKRGLTFPKLKQVRTISETVATELRLLCKEVWGVPLTASYSSEELGYMAIQCPRFDHYHIQAEGVLIEVLDDTGQPCQPGEVGRVVATSLLNYATPLIRYEIGDYAEVGGPCPCGLGLPVISRILGRQRNMVTFPSGEKCWPVFGIFEMRDAAPLKQVQVIQHSLSLVEVKYTATRSLAEGEERKLRTIIQNSLGYPFSVKFTALEHFPKQENGKHEEFISMVS